MKVFSGLHSAWLRTTVVMLGLAAVWAAPAFGQGYPFGFSSGDPSIGAGAGVVGWGCFPPATIYFGGAGVHGFSGCPAGNGTIGEASIDGASWGILGISSTGSAGVFLGNVFIFPNGAGAGDLSVSGMLSKGGGTFKIDHPLDPANKYLYHSFVESPDMKNIYDGVAVLDANGKAVVHLPDYFQALNTGFRYQLTSIGGFAPVYIAQEVQNNQFEIGGGKPGMKISWQVTGVRQDAFANAHRVQVEVDKPAEERGLYQHPTELGFPVNKGVAAAKVNAKLQQPVSGK